MFILRPEGGLSNHRHLVCVTWINHRLIGMEAQPPGTHICRADYHMSCQIRRPKVQGLARERWHTISSDAYDAGAPLGVVWKLAVTFVG